MTSDRIPLFCVSMLFGWTTYTLSHRGEYVAALMSAVLSCTTLVLWIASRSER